MSRLLQIEQLTVDLAAGTVLRGVDLALDGGEALGLVGESGSGKSMTLRAITRLLPAGARTTGAITFDGAEVFQLGRRELRALRAREIAVIFQDPRASINPMRTIGDFLTEVLRERGVRRGEAERRAIAVLQDVGIADAARRLGQRPHELSGGLLQRVMIAAALLAEARLILADEPTTALDVTTQEEVMAILDEQRRERGLAMIFVTHDLELAAAVCDRIAVMYAGAIVEIRPAATLHECASHPYTVALLAARPGTGEPGRHLRTVEGSPLSAFEAPSGCAFAARCPLARERCLDQAPALRELEGGSVACHFAEEVIGRPAAEVIDG